MKKLFNSLLLLLVSLSAFGQTQTTPTLVEMPKPREIDKDYRQEYRQALREAERAVEEANGLPGDIIQLPKEEMVPVEILTPQEFSQAGLWDRELLVPGNTGQRLVEAWKYPVYIEGLDTGVDEDHPHMQVGKVGPTIDGIGEPGGDLNGHGTHTLGTIVGQGDGLLWPAVEAGHVTWGAVKVLNRSGRGNFNIYATQHGSRYTEAYKPIVDGGGYVATVNSLGYDGPPLEYVERELAKGWNYPGIFHVAASGNSNTTTDYPGSSNNTIAVNALNQQLTKAYFSCFGPQSWVSMPGVNIKAPWIGGGYATIQGTSMACPEMTAFVVAALGIHGPLVDEPHEMIAYTEKCSRDLGDKGFDHTYGYGMAMITQVLEVQPDGQEPDPDPNPDPEPPAPEPVQWEINISTTGHAMRWADDFNQEYKLVSYDVERYTCRTTAATYDEAYQDCHGFLDWFHSSSSIVGTAHPQATGYWTGRFAYIISKNKGGALLTPTFLEGADEARQAFYIDDFGFTATGLDNYDETETPTWVELNDDGTMGVKVHQMEGGWSLQQGLWEHQNTGTIFHLSEDTPPAAGTDEIERYRRPGGDEQQLRIIVREH